MMKSPTATQRHLLYPSSAIQRLRQIQEDNVLQGSLAQLRLSERTAFVGDFDLASTDKALRDFARGLAAEAKDLAQEWHDEPWGLLGALAELCGRYSTTVPPSETVEHCVTLLSDPSWWSKNLRTLQAQHHDQIARALNTVCRAKQCYVSDRASTLRQQHDQRAQDYLENYAVRNYAGDQKQLAEIAEHTISNPEVRNAELMVRIKGFEQVSHLYQHEALFITLTAPSRFHATRPSGDANPKYDLSNPKQAHAWIQDAWELIRSKLHRKAIRPYGFRVVEPHHDGTPHWHLLLFCDPTHRKPIQRTIRHYAMREPEEGADAHRVKFERIDPTKGSAVGYIAKYISKSLDGKYIDTDLEGNPGTVAAQRIVAWARTWKIRQFQQIGGPSVSVWRELRRLEPSDGPADALAAARTAADAGDWAAYVIAMGGADCRRADRPIGLYRDYWEKVDTRTGEILPDDTAWHGGRRHPPIRGLATAQAVVVTRVERWTPIYIGRCARKADPQGPPEHGAFRRAAPSLGPV